MRDFLSWNLSLGRWFGVQVRLHAFFLLLAVVALHLATQPGDDKLLGYTVAGLLVLFFSVLAHEFGHVYAARRVHGSADQVLLWPLGGLVQTNVSHSPEEEFYNAAAGPLVNLGIAVTCVPVLLLAAVPPSEVFWQFVNPLVPPSGTRASFALTAVELTLWLNMILVWVNLLPAFPLDGAQFWRALLWPKYGFRTAVALVARAAWWTALALIVAAWLLHARYPFAWLPLSLIGILLFFSARQDAERLHEHEPDDTPGGYDFSQGYTSLEKHLQQPPPTPKSPGWLEGWLKRRREQRDQQRRQIEADEERRADEILARLHESGYETLSADDRALLERVSRRYRNRQQG